MRAKVEDVNSTFLRDTKTAQQQLGDWLLDAKTTSTTLSPNRQEVYSFDLEGRPLSWFVRGRVYKRSLGSQVFGRETVAGERRRWTLGEDEAAEQFGAVRERLARLETLDIDETLRHRLRDILRWTPERLVGERARFAAVYQPISILPPDQYQAVVLQATYGCSWNRCTFCNFYQDRPFSVKDSAAFGEHVRGVKDFLGRGAALRRSIFLADGNALVLSNGRLEPLITLATRSFPGRDLYGFVDVFSGERKPLRDWQQLAAWGLKRVYIGLETGHDALLAWLNKPGSAVEAYDFIVTLKQAGLQVSTIVMVGAGGHRFADAHRRDTLALLARLPLGRGDLVYLSPFIDHPTVNYRDRAAEDDIRPLSNSERASEMQRFKDAIRAESPDVKVAPYDLREFLY